MSAHFTERVFQLWEYRVSHGQMLIRSPKDQVHKANVDIVFAGVEYVDLPRYLHGLEIDDPTQADIAFAADRLGKPVEAKAVTVLKVGPTRHIVVAAAIKVVESNTDIFASPLH